MGRTRRRKRTTHVSNNDAVEPNAAAEEKPPLTFVIGRGHLSQDQQKLVRDFRRAMEPLTAAKLQVRKRNKIQDFVNVAGPLGVTQMIMFSATELGTYMRVVSPSPRLPARSPAADRSCAGAAAARADADLQDQGVRAL